MSLEYVTKRVAPSALWWHCIVLWIGMAFKVVSDLLVIGTRVQEEYLTRGGSIMVMYWTAFFVVSVAEAIFIGLIGKGYHWARWCWVPFWLLAALSLVPGLPVPVELAASASQSPFSGWGEILAVILSPFASTDTAADLLGMVAPFVKIVLLIANAWIFYFLPSTRRFFAPRPHGTAAPVQRKQLRPLY